MHRCFPSALSFCTRDLSCPLVVYTATGKSGKAAAAFTTSISESSLDASESYDQNCGVLCFFGISCESVFVCVCAYCAL